MKDIVLKQKLRKGRRKARRKSGEESYQERRNNSVQQTRDRKKQARKRLRMVQAQRNLDKQSELVRNCPINKPEIVKRPKGPLQQHEWKLRGAARPAALLARIANGECDADGNEFKAPEKTVNLFETMKGKFAEREETVEYLRLRKDVALATCQAGMVDEGIAHFQACLELDPTDVVCAREGLVCALVDEGRADEARVFLDQFESTTGVLEYCRVIIEYVSWEVLEEEGSSEELVQAAFQKAWNLNPFIAMFIGGYESFNAVVEYVDEIKSYEKGSIEEAFIYCANNIGVWLDTVGAQAWIQKEINEREEPIANETHCNDEMYLGMYHTAIMSSVEEKPIVSENTAPEASLLQETAKAGEAAVKPEFRRPVQPKEEGEGERERGTFKKRPRDPADDPANLLCRGVAAGEGCEFGDSCRFSHDVEDFVKRRPKDLGDSCPVYTAVGYCRYGLNCRYGMSHVDANNVNLGKPADEKSVEMNDLDVPTRDLLRKNTFPFRTVPASHHKKGCKPKQQRQIDYEIVENPVVPEHKPVDFKGKIYVGPLTTVGNLPFRRVLKHWGADITCGEMAMATNLLQGQASEWALLRRHESEDVFGVQIAGAFGDQVARVCELITRKTTVDFIDINMGCPIDLVCKAGAGAALMNRPPKLCSVISGALSGIELGSFGLSTRPGLTVKMRAGWSEKSPVAHKLLPKVQSATSSSEFMNQSVVLNYAMRTDVRVDAMTIHGRSRLQRYTKNADWVYVAECADARGEDKSLQMIGGGDVLSYEEFHEHLKSGQLDTCMLARGALIKPWLPTEIKERRHFDISASERLDILKDFVKCGLEHWGSDQKGINRTRRYLLEWQSFLCRYVPVGILEKLPQRINDRPMPYYGRNDLETLMASDQAADWIKISEMLLGPVPEGFQFMPKHKANAYG